MRNDFDEQVLGPRNWTSLRRRGEGHLNRCVRGALDSWQKRRELADQSTVQRIAFFQSAVRESPETFTIADIQPLIEM